MSKKRLFAAVLALATLQGIAAELPSYPFIHARGTSFMYVLPDLGEIDFEITSHHAAPEAALELVQQRVAEIKALAAEKGVAGPDVEFSDIRRVVRKSDAIEPEYSIKCAVHIVVRDLGKWRELMAPLLAMPNVDGFGTVFGVTERVKIETELMGKAVREATLKADAMAVGFGKRVGAVAGVSSDELRNLTRSLGLAPSDRPRSTSSAKNTPQDEADLMMVSALKMSQSVDVIFRIK